MALSARLGGILLLVPQLERSMRFWSDGVGLQIVQQTREWASLDDGNLELQQTSSVAACVTGYTPLIRVHVTDVDESVRACVALGGVMDGPIRRPLYGMAAASIRAPDGHMIGLVERVAEEMIEDVRKSAASLAARRRIDQAGTRKFDVEPELMDSRSSEAPIPGGLNNRDSG